MDARESTGTVSYLAGKMDMVTPSIKVSGGWLREYGFGVADKILITTREGEITIKKEIAPVQV